MTRSGIPLVHGVGLPTSSRVPPTVSMGPVSAACEESLAYDALLSLDVAPGQIDCGRSTCQGAKTRWRPSGIYTSLFSWRPASRSPHRTSPTDWPPEWRPSFGSELGETVVHRHSLLFLPDWFHLPQIQRDESCAASCRKEIHPQAVRKTGVNPARNACLPICKDLNN